MIDPKVKFIIIDLFCGFGGTTTGYHQTNGLAKVVACINHDPKAIQSHWLNYPDVTHFEEDIRTLNLTSLSNLLKDKKKQYPNSKVILWASLECTNFSKAKGGLPRDADSRTLACGLLRYIKRLKPDYIKIENVVEFMAWGPLDENGKPVSKKNGSEWINWKNSINQLGYNDEWRELNSANFGAYTSRNRLFGCFAKIGLPITWPNPTHAKNVEKCDLFSNHLKPWKPVKDVLQLNIEGESIFNRRKPLSDKTLQRIYAGLIKYVAGGKESFITKYYGTGNNIQSIEEVAPTIVTKDRIALNKVHFIKRDFSNGANVSSVNSPAGSITQNPKLDLVSVEAENIHYIVNPSYYGHASSVEKPCPVIIARQDKAPLYLIDAEKGYPGREVENSDTEVMIKIKDFMFQYGISDIKMRMLMVAELLMIQGFPEDYRMVGNQTDAKKFIGNSVVPIVVKQWCLSMSKVI